MTRLALDGPTLLDGAMGTALIARGLPTHALPEEWILSRPDEVARVHAEHSAAGARVLLTCTFNCAAPRLAARVDPARVEAICGWAERLARGAARGGLVAGALGPTGLAAPGAPTAGSARLAALYERPMAALCAAGADLLWIESQCDLGESLAALGVARRMGRAAVVTFTPHRTSGGLRIADGTPAEDCLAAAQAGGAAAAGVNCLDPDPALAELAAWAAERLRIPFVAKPSAGLPGAVLPPGAFAEAMAGALRAGLRVAGGCCGTTGEHIRALGAAMTGSP